MFCGLVMTSPPPPAPRDSQGILRITRSNGPLHPSVANERDGESYGVWPGCEGCRFNSAVVSLQVQMYRGKIGESVGTTSILKAWSACHLVALFVCVCVCV